MMIPAPASQMTLPGLRSKVGKTLYFYPLKDSRGTIQLVVSSDVDAEVFERMRSIPVESTVLIQGTVSERPAKQKRPVSFSTNFISFIAI